MDVKVKVCGLKRREDVELARELGARALGFVFEPSSPRFVGSSDWAPYWLDFLDSMTVAVYGKAPMYPPKRGFVAIQAADWGDEEGGVSEQALLTIHVIRLRAGQSIDEAIRATANSAMVLLDTFDPGLYGGTGRTIDWPYAADVCAALRAFHRTRPFVRIGLAGGLTPENVATAVEIVKPDYVDVASGVESAPGIKDSEKLKSFFAALR